MTRSEPNDVVYPWEEPDDESRAAQPAPSVETEMHEVEAQGETGAVLDAADTHVPDPARADAANGGGHGAGNVDAETEGGPGVAPLERPIAPKEYYAISEVCDLVDLKPHVLRYWETQFGVLNPSKNRSGNRVYQRKEIKLILLVKHLLYEEKYTVEGAKQKLEQLRRGGELGAATAQALEAGTVDMLRTELRRLSEILTVAEPD